MFYSPSLLLSKDSLPKGKSVLAVIAVGKPADLEVKEINSKSICQEEVIISISFDEFLRKSSETDNFCGLGLPDTALRKS